MLFYPVPSIVAVLPPVVGSDPECSPDEVASLLLRGQSHADRAKSLLARLQVIHRPILLVVIGHEIWLDRCSLLLDEDFV